MISELFIRRPVMTVLLIITTFIIGIASYYNLPVSNLPDVNYPVITVTVRFPGTNPAIMANTVASPLEKQFMTIPGIRYVTSTSSLGLTTIILQFEIEKNIDLVAVDVEAAIAAALPQLPPDLPQTPTYKKVNPSSTPIIYLALTSSTLTAGELYDYGNTFAGQRISILNGVAQVNVYGSPFAVRAQIDPGIAASMGITLQEIANAISDGNQYQPLGQLDGTHTAPLIYDNGGLYKAASYIPLIVVYRNGSPVALGDLGNVYDSTQNDRTFRRYIDSKIDETCVVLAVQGQPGANIVKVADSVRKILPEIEKQLPGSASLKVVFDRSESIKASLAEIEFTLFLAFILVVMVIFIYLGNIRDTIIPSIVMPMSIIATFALLDFFGYTLDNLSLLAITLAIGFIIDDAIVVLENIVRRIEDGQSVLEASIKGSRQISFTIISMTLSLVAVFIPLLFMGGIIGKLFQEFAVTLSIVTLLSGILALSVTPMLCSRFLPSLNQEKKTSISIWSDNLNRWMLKHYKQSLTWVLKHQFIAILTGLLSVAATLYLFSILPTDFIPDEDIGFIQAYTESEQGTSSEMMGVYQNELLEIIKKEPSIASIVSIVANPQYRQGVFFISLVPRNQRKPIKEIIAQLNIDLKKIPGVNIFLKNVPLIDLNIGTQVRGSYQFLLQSLDPNELYSAAEALYEKMRSEPVFQGTSSDLERKTPQLQIEILRDHAATLGITAQNIEQAMRLSFSGNRISRIQTPIDQYDVIVELNRQLQNNASSLNLIYLRSSTTNALVPLSAVVNLTEGIGPASINHFAQFPAVTLTFNIDPSVPLSVGLETLRTLAAQTLPPSVNGDVKGAAQTFEESIQNITLLLLVTILVIYLVLGILYESYIHPLTILSTLPPAIVGGLLALYISNQPLSLYAYLGLILLIGIVKKNGIMIVDYALANVREKNENAENSIFDACLVRFRPIMMTTVAAIMGAAPLAFGIGGGAEARRPLGYVIIGGMILAQVITLFVTPVIYLKFEKMRERFSTHKNPP